MAGTRTGELRRLAGAGVRGLIAFRPGGLSCPLHGQTEFAIEGSGYYRCKRCRAEGVARRRRKLKAILVAEAGGKCRICGYDGYIGALEFHHVEPDEKRLAISGYGVTLSLEALRSEARKCVLLCSNCHAEVENGAASLPDKVPRGVGSIRVDGSRSANTP